LRQNERYSSHASSYQALIIVSLNEFANDQFCLARFHFLNPAAKLSLIFLAVERVVNLKRDFALPQRLPSENIERS
jgi:hypothetical protein